MIIKKGNKVKILTGKDKNKELEVISSKEGAILNRRPGVTGLIFLDIS